jgi:hypothetical protein
MKTKYITIQDIRNDNDYIYIEGDILYRAPIINGSVDFIITDTNNNQLYLSNININDIVRIYYKNNIIKKIIIDTKYEILTDTSDTENIEIIN